jgi:hypothetical protein
MLRCHLGRGFTLRDIVLSYYVRSLVPDCNYYMAGVPPQVSGDQARYAAVDKRLVGSGAQDQLHRRLANHPILVPAVRVQVTGALFSGGLLPSVAHPQVRNWYHGCMLLCLSSDATSCE